MPRKKKVRAEAIQLETANANIQQLQLRLLHLISVLDEEAGWLEAAAPDIKPVQDAFLKRAKYLRKEAAI